jgi:hypothetical protein
MSIVGTWNVSIATPMGAQVISLEFSDELDGVARRGADSLPLQDVSVAGNTATFTVALTQPIRVTAQCTVEIDGDAMTGTARAGFFGTFGLTGNRVP